MIECDGVIVLENSDQFKSKKGSHAVSLHNERLVELLSQRLCQSRGNESHATTGRLLRAGTPARQQDRDPFNIRREERRPVMEYTSATAGVGEANQPRPQVQPTGCTQSTLMPYGVIAVFWN
jgi:hypothetical protein